MCVKWLWVERAWRAQESPGAEGAEAAVLESPPAGREGVWGLTRAQWVWDKDGEVKGMLSFWQDTLGFS